MKGLSRQKNDRRVRRSVFSANDVLLLLASAATCVALFLLIRLLPPDPTVEVNELSLRATWLVVVMISALDIAIFSLHKKLTLEAPTRRILDAAARIGKGDFTVRIKPFHKKYFKNEFDVIIEDLNRMAAELEGVETMKTDFIANVSHELKTPLAVLGNYAMLLQEADLSEEKRLEYTRAVADSTRRLNMLVSNILKLNKLESQQIFPENDVFDLGEQLCEALLSFDHRMDEKQLELQTDLEDDVIIRADSELLMHIWDNLISNAVKFTPEGGTLTVTLRKSRKYAVVSVADTGCGMTPEEQQHIFEKFYQGDRSRSVQGNGLGLALVRRIVDVSGGMIDVKSAPDEGSTFTVRLPLNADDV